MNSYQRIGLIMGIVFAIVICNSFVLAQDQERRAILRGLQGCGVIVEDLEPEIERDGLTKEQIQTDMELKLRMAGIKVLSREEAFKTGGAPYFYLNVAAMEIFSEHGASRGYIYYMSVSLKERVLPVRNGDTVWGTTWERPGFLGVTTNLTDIRQGAKDLVDYFINDYLAANPK